MAKKDKKSKKNTSLRLRPEILKGLKRRAVDDERSVQSIVEDLIEKFLEEGK